MNAHSIALIGTSGVGKTCFIAVLRWLGTENGSGFISGGTDGTSRKYLEDLRTSLQNKRLPEATHRETVLVFPEQYKDVEFVVNMRDFRGEDLKEMDSSSPLFQSWVQCETLFVLLDVEDDLLSQTPKREQNMGQLFDVLIRPEMSLQEKSVAFLLMKADVCGHTKPEDDSRRALQFLEEKGPTYLDKLRQRGITPACFFISPIGARPKEDGMLPEQGIRPFGYQQLFDWYVAECKNRTMCALKKRVLNWVVKSAAVLAVVLSVWGGVEWWQASREKQYVGVLNSPSATLHDKALTTHKVSENGLSKYMGWQVEEFRNRLEQAQSVQEIRGAIDCVRSFEAEARIGEQFRQQMDLAVGEGVQKLEEILVKGVEESVEQPEICRSLIADYLADKLIPHQSMDRIQAVRKKIDTMVNKEKREKIRSIQIYPFSAAKLQEKMAAIKSYEFESAEVKAEADRAIKAMNLLLNQSTFHLTSFNAWELGKERRTYLVWAFGESDIRELETNKFDKDSWTSKTGYQVGCSPQWNEEREVTWKPGTPVRMEWRWNAKFGISDCVLGVWQGGFDDPLMFLRFLQTLELVQTERYSKFRVDVRSPRVRVTCREFPDPGADLDAIEKFLIPGSYWQDSSKDSEVPQ